MERQVIHLSIHEMVQDPNKGNMKRVYEVHNGQREEDEPSSKVFIKDEVHRPFIKIEPKEEPADYDDG